MIMHDWNTDNEEIVLLIHPMLSSGNGMKTFIADNIGSDFRYLAPDLSAHSEAISDTYISAAEEASEIHDYLLAHNASHLTLAYGASLGGIVLFQLLNYTDISFDRLFFEGTSFYTNSRLLCKIISSNILKKHKKAVNDPELCRSRIAEMFGENGADILAAHFIGMNEESITHIVHDCGFVDLPALSDDIQKNSVFAYGDKDFDYKRARKILPKTYPSARIEVWQGYGHCGRLSKDTKNYAAMLARYMRSGEISA